MVSAARRHLGSIASTSCVLYGSGIENELPEPVGLNRTSARQQVEAAGSFRRADDDECPGGGRRHGGRDGFRQIAVRRRHDAEIHGYRLRGPEALDAMILQHARSSFGCSDSGSSPISSSSTVPPAAASKRPILRWMAPVKTPRS